MGTKLQYIPHHNIQTRREEGVLELSPKEDKYFFQRFSPLASHWPELGPMPFLEKVLCPGKAGC